MVMKTHQVQELFRQKMGPSIVILTVVDPIDDDLEVDGENFVFRVRFSDAVKRLGLLPVSDADLFNNSLFSVVRL